MRQVSDEISQVKIMQKMSLIQQSTKKILKKQSITRIDIIQIQNHMKSYKLFFVAAMLITTTIAGFTNTTSFWQTMLNDNQIDFQVYSGYQEIDWYYPKDTSGMYYNLFSAMGHKIGNNQSSADIPLLIWLQGGPGASSQFGAFTEIGPIRIDKGKAKLFHSSWNIFGHLLFIDQPLNVGFSFAKGDRQGKQQVSSAHEAADHLLNFLDNFYKTWPKLRQSPLYITGESFGGHYVPAFARKLIINQTWRVSNRVKLEGISIGDGWTDPMNQVNFYDSFLWSVGVVDSKFRDVCTWFQTNAMINMYNGNYKNATSYFDFLTNNDTTPEVYFGNISMFNFRNYDGLDESFAKILQDNKNSIGAKVDFIPGNDAVYTSFADDISRSYEGDVALALRSIKVLIYNGQEDVVVNTAGVLQYLNSLNWEGTGAWKRAKKEIWTIHGENAGWAKVSGNLWFALVNGAGHMVPTDQPQRAFSLLGHFINNERVWKQ